MNPCESYDKELSLTKKQETHLLLEKIITTHLLQEKKEGTHLKPDSQKEEKKEIHLQQEEKREINQVNKEITHLQEKKEEAQEEKLNFLKQEDAHLQVKPKKTPSHVQRKGTQLHHELKKAHLQQKGKKGTYLEEKTGTPGLLEKQKEEAHWQQEQKKKEKKKKRKFMWVKGKHSICLPKPSAVCSGARPHISNPSPLVRTAATREESSFRIWLRSRGEDDACSHLTMGKSLHGRGLFASRQILAGECILRISKQLVITPDKLHDEVKHLLHENISNCARLALLILAEQYAGQASEWAPYMNCLPQLGALHNTVLWNDNELELIRQSSSAYRHSMQYRATISEEFAAVQHVLQQCPHIFGQSVTCTNFRHAYAVVKSRAWGVDEGNTVGLVPFVDFFNHDASCQSYLSFDNEYDYAEVVADRDYTYGEQVFINYGKFGNDILAVTFGFALEFNPYDQVEIWMGLSQRDALRKMKLQLLHSHGMPILSGFGGLDDGGNSFLIKEVKAIKGRGKGIPQSLRAFARVLCANSSQELIEMARQASELDGRLARQPLKDVHKELQAMVLLLARVESLIQDYVAAILALEMADFCKVYKKSVPCIRRKMAEDILDGELRILRSAANWLKHHCIALNSLL